MYCGWFQDSILDLTHSKWEVFRKLPYCLVTCTDSTHDLKSITTAWEITEWEGSCSFLGRSLIIGDGKMLGYARSLFSHFDEIWLYEHRPTVEKPTEVSIVSPLELNRENPSGELLEWFGTSGCVLGLDDGIGMNYVTTSREILESLEARQRQFGSGKN